MRYHLKIIVLLVIILTASMLYSQPIGSIDNIRNPELRFNIDRYNGTILSYEDRLIVSNIYKIEEFIILPNGELSRIGFFELKDNWSCAYINGDRYYILHDVRDGQYVIGQRLYIFDLSVAPMLLITYVPIPVDLGSFARHLFFSDEHIMISDYYRQRTIMIGKETYEVDDYWAGLYGAWIYIDGNILIQPYVGPGHIQMKAFEIYEDNYLVEISSLDLVGFGTGPQDVVYENRIMSIPFQEGWVVIDYNDPSNPFIIGSLLTGIPGFTETSFKYPYLFAYSFYHLYVYELNEHGVFNQIFFDTLSNAGSRNMHYREPYLYVNGESNMRVYDASDDFNIAHIHGGGYMHYYPGLSFSENDLYYLELNLFTQTQKIYSVLDNALICTLNYSQVNHVLGDVFEIRGNRLYFSDTREEPHYFDIYELENEEATLINRIYIDSRRNNNFKLYGDKVFFTYSDPIETIVYTLINDDIIYSGSFAGTLQWRYGTPNSEDYILSFDNNILYFRDINNYSTILLQTSFNLGNRAFANYNNGTFTAFGMTLPTSQVYDIDFSTGNINQIGNLTSGDINIFREIITLNRNNSYMGEYYTMLNGELTMIGSESYPERDVWLTYFFAESGKMVQVAKSGIWVYDFDYTVSDKDFTVISPSDILLSNYPNPFNPETTISYTLPIASNLCIDIYNIRGQKIKTLVNDFSAAGNHQVIWNGTDENGQSIGSGVYFYRLVSDDFNQTKKMILMK